MTTNAPEWTPPIGYPRYSDEWQIPKFADQALQSVVEHYLTKVHVPLPERRYWTIGQTAHDCEQAVLAIQQMFLGTAENPLELTQCNGPRGVTFTFEVIRCVPTLTNRGQAPAARDIENASVNPVIDMEIMLDVAKYFDPYEIGVVVNVDPITANGVVHGAIATYSVSL